MGRIGLGAVLLVVTASITACGGPAGEGEQPAGSVIDAREEGSAPEAAGVRTPTSPPGPANDPEYRYNQLLGRDSIRPVYAPEFVPADQAPLDDEELVLGIEIDGEAKAYPIWVLNFREMVNDELAGVSILATW